MSAAGAKPRKFIAVAGNIGAGKSTMVDFLCQRHGRVPFTEPNLLNPYLDDFYEDMGSWASHSQISFLAHKFQQHQEIIWKGRSAVQDRTIYEDSIFAKMLVNLGLMDERD